ncbi:hypothetical protein BJ741DRAFT_237780 [Chytriomyces cf. hyalinus JEL632]|nr:hypothetical protein BJ741DRAFT_237780 [Chytriomyces cf. hyalinus JEL632]
MPHSLADRWCKRCRLRVHQLSAPQQCLALTLCLLYSFMFAFLRSRHRYPDLVKNNHTIVPVLAAISTIVGYSLHKYSHSSCLDRYAAKFPAEAAEWKRLMKEKIEKEGN